MHACMYVSVHLRPYVRAFINAYRTDEPNATVLPYQSVNMTQARNVSLLDDTIIS